MIPVGVLCYVMGDPTTSAPLPSRFCVVKCVPGKVRRGCYDDRSPDVCDVEFANGKVWGCCEWRLLRPITPPPVDVQTQRDRTLETM